MRKMISVLLFSFISTSVFAATYELDKSHSSVGFRIAHMGFGKTTGKFNDFKGKINFEAGKSETWSVEAEIQTASIDTNDQKRDDHLRGPDFFDAKKFPKITFKSTKVSEPKDGKATLTGNLTMHGVTKEVKLELEIAGQGKDPWGNDRAGFSAKGKINREDFGIVYNKTLEIGGVLIGKEVEITIEAESIAKKEEAKGSKK